jgi:hypothetical protein
MRYNPLKGSIDGYYRLIESYRNSDGRVCHRTLLNVGFLDMTTVSPEQLNRIQKILTVRCKAPTSLLLFEEKIEDPVVRDYVEALYARLVSEKKIDVVESPDFNQKGDWQTIDMNSVRNHDVREIGSEWLCYQALEELKMFNFLASLGWEDTEIRLALTHIISRAVYPASELCTSRWIKENSSVCELTGYPIEKINKDQLYRISKKLYGEKSKLENYLSHQTNELFDIEDKIILYDLTNTYFEGRMENSRIAKFGRSKEKRNDAKLIVLGLVVNPEGFIKYSSILEGNVSDCSTLAGMINELRLKTSTSATKAIVVMDAGIATGENLKILKEKGYDYICVSRSKIKNYTVKEGDCEVFVTDKKNRKISLQKVSPAKKKNTETKNDTDYYLKISSETKRKKECAMNKRFRKGFEDGLKSITASLSKKGGVKQEDKVLQRIGRLKAKYPSIQRHFDIKYEVNDIKNENNDTGKEKKRKAKSNEEKRIVTSINWTVNEDIEINARSGIYFLTTSLQNDEQVLWQSYNTIRYVEYSNRVLKNDLNLRPIYHKRDDTSMAHLHLGLMAYWVVNTVRYKLKKKEVSEKIESIEPVSFQWKEIVRIMNNQKAVTTMAQNKVDEIILIRRCTAPIDNAKMIYDKLGYKYNPFKKKKYVVHKKEFEKKYPAEFKSFNSS